MLFNKELNVLWKVASEFLNTIGQMRVLNISQRNIPLMTEFYTTKG